LTSSGEITDRIYAGLLGKAIGVRLGAPLESTVWTLARSRATFGEIDGYTRSYGMFAADDDTNGPLYFIRAVTDYGPDPSAEQLGKTWLNYTADSHGMFWWGGYGISTEHTAYENLKAGIPAPASGSITQNGTAVAEQIGGQIFVDSWGWINPGNPARAADMAARAASVSHDGEGLNGARWVAAAIAAAFVAGTVGEIVSAAMAAIPADSEYARVAQAVIAFHRDAPGDWYACRLMLEHDFGYDPNAGALALAVLYGGGDLNCTVEIATMCSWDTDCNAGNAGAIIGTFQQVQPHWQKYREPINDVLIASGVATTLNITDIPSFALELADLAGHLAGPATRARITFDFDLPGSTHGFRVDGSNRFSLSWSDERPRGGRGTLRIDAENIPRHGSGRIHWKPFYRRSDFDDERYMPMLAPLVATGQQVSFELLSEPWEGGEEIRVQSYVRRAMSGRIDEIGGWTSIPHGEWTRYGFTIPPTGSEAIDQIGFAIANEDKTPLFGRFFLANFYIDGAGTTIIDPAIETNEWGGVTRFTRNRGHWSIADGVIHAHSGTDADCWTGAYDAGDVTVAATLTPLAGRSHLITARAMGACRFYAAGFDEGRIVILKEDFGATLLAELPFQTMPGRRYDLSFSVIGDLLELSVDGEPLLSARDRTFGYGMSGLRLGRPGRMSVSRLSIIEAPTHASGAP
jgi:hypothetical protein